MGAVESPASVWHLYMVRCRNGELYTGIATDVERRLDEHRAGSPKGAKFLRGRGPIELVFCREVGARDLALRIEARIKKLSRQDKKRLVDGTLSFDHVIDFA